MVEEKHSYLRLEGERKRKKHFIKRMRAKLYSCKQHSAHEKYSASYKTSRIERVVISKRFDKRSFKIVKEIYLC